MPYFIYSHESLPNPSMMGKPRYTPDSDYIKLGGITLPALPKQEWLELNEDDPRYVTVRHADWRDRHGTEIEVPLKRFKKLVDNPNNSWAERGVVMLDHLPTPEEKKHIAGACSENNLRFRKKAVEFFENQRDMAKARQGTYDPNPYVDECYDILNMPKPYSLDALQEQRRPGEYAAVRLADAMAKGQQESAKVIADAVAEVLTRPAKAEQPKEGFFKR